jgi:hypothetical protein
MLSFNLSEPVTLKRFLALDLVFILGIFPSVLIYSYLLSLRGTKQSIVHQIFMMLLYKAIFLAIQFLYRQKQVELLYFFTTGFVDFPLLLL